MVSLPITLGVHFCEFPTGDNYRPTGDHLSSFNNYWDASLFQAVSRGNFSAFDRGRHDNGTSAMNNDLALIFCVALADLIHADVKNTAVIDGFRR